MCVCVCVDDGAGVCAGPGSAELSVLQYEWQSSEGHKNSREPDERRQELNNSETHTTHAINLYCVYVTLFVMTNPSKNKSMMCFIEAALHVHVCKPSFVSLSVAAAQSVSPALKWARDRWQ